MGHLRARDVLFDGVVDYSRLQELVNVRAFDVLRHPVCQVVLFYRPDQ
jgi:hypothetical protein